MGRPTKYSAKLAAKICERMAAGESVRKICRDAAMPSFRTIMSWAHDQTQVAYKEGFPAQYQAAMRSMAQNMFDELLEIADEEKRDAQRSRLMVDTRKWYLSKCLPKVFGDKMNLDHSGEIGLSKISDDELDAKLAAIDAAISRATNGRDG